MCGCALYSMVGGATRAGVGHAATVVKCALGPTVECVVDPRPGKQEGRLSLPFSRVGTHVLIADVPIALALLLGLV